MKSIYLIAIVLAGFILLYLGISGLSSTAYLFNQGEDTNILEILFWCSLFSSLFFIVFGLILIIRPQIFERFAGGNEDTTSSLNISGRNLLQVGIILIGLYIFIQYLPYWINAIYSLIIGKTLYGKPADYSRITISCVVLLQSLIMILFSKRISDRLFSADKTETDSESPQ